MEILAFPYAYGSASVYSELKAALGSKFAFYSFDYPGHGSRIEEKTVNSIDKLADEALNHIEKFIHKPYCLLGYSMGGYVVFELYQKLKRLGKPLPKYIFLLASREPSWIHDKCDFEHSTLEDVKDILRKKNGTSEEILREDDLISLLAPAIIADSIALRDYTCDNSETLPVECGVTIIRGNKETKLDNCKEEWEKALKRSAEYILVDGEHFFLFQGKDDVKKIVSTIISDRLSVIL